MPTQRAYASFLIRIWRRDAPHGQGGVVVLEDTSSGERTTFASLAEAFVFLEAASAGNEPRDRPANAASTPGP